MAQCPNCHSQIEIGSEYFGGLFTCPQCQSVYFISFDGVPEGSTPETTPNEPTPYEVTPNELTPNEIPSDLENSLSAELPQEASGDSPEVQGFTNPIANEPVDASFGMQTDYNLNEAQETTVDPLQEIVDFGNTETVVAPISYRLRLKGIDLIQNMEDLKSVFSDSKLEMDFDQLKSKIRKGELLIEKIEAGQAAVIAQRLRALPLTMIWEQKIYE